MKWQELHNWVEEIERLTGGNVGIRTLGALLEVSVNWRDAGQRFTHREAFTPIELDELNSASIRNRLDFVTKKIRRDMGAKK